ncbi:hypothetical protein BDQ12DRAFT_667209 [Crucibulum laeve]|uniref:C2H2-type domain-containing protein n=1 Tax=Crucibulum laeve TaxID=68775 RepID=A0A5C3LWT7_9AGAR|nr:hypothetical protein BDQ12DRAFT_667209 [Crucibulum laeve]
MDPIYQQPPSSSSSYYGAMNHSNPSSTHSSPRSYPSDLPSSSSYPSNSYGHSQTYPIPNGSAYPQSSYTSQQRRPAPKNASYSSPAYTSNSYGGPVPLQVSTSTSTEHDPNERTARPGNAHKHAMFHSLSVPLPSSSAISLPPSNGSSTSLIGGTAMTEEPSQDTQTNDYTASTPGLSQGLTRALTALEQERLAHLDRLKFFLATAPSRWDTAAPSSSSFSSSSSLPSSTTNSLFTNTTGAGGPTGYSAFPPHEPYHAPPHPALNRFLLPTQECVTCVLWNGLYHITGTDIVRALVFRFEAFGRPVRNMKKFEEGVFSDLRNLKPGVDACLEEPKSPFLDLLFKYQCIRTQKKQKVFYWFSVPHDRLFLDALERDLKREKMGLEPTTQIVGEPALSFTYDPKKSLYEQFSKAQGAREGEGELEAAVRRATEEGQMDSDSNNGMQDDMEGVEGGTTGESEMSDAGDDEQVDPVARQKKLSALQGANGMFVSLPGGSPSYKQRKKKGSKASGLRKGSEDYDERGRGRSVGGGGGDRYSSVSASRERIPRPMHTSMLEEFGENGYLARVEKEPTAAELFRKQAAGELLPGTGVPKKQREQAVVGEVGVFYSGGGPAAPVPTQPISYAALQQPSMHHRGRSHDEGHRNAYAGSAASGSMSAGYNTTSFPASQVHIQNQQQSNLAALNMTATSHYEAVSADGKMKAFVCPLFSCGRLFKRMEHLKRHLRTHTMERPFSCPKCKKKFSRSDNLNQHLRTHERSGPGSGTDEFENGEDADASGSGEGSTGQGSGSDEDNVAYASGSVAGIGGVDIFGNPSGEMEMLNAYSMLGANAYNAVGGLDVNMCEVDVGDVREVSGDEEGLIMRTGAGAAMGYGQQPEGFYGTSSVPTTGSGMLFSGNQSDFTDSQWASRPPAGSAFGANATPPVGNLPHIRNNANRASFHAMRPTPPPSSGSSASSYGDDYVTSISAPSHKQAFDHSSLYPPSMLGDSLPGGAGPMRRHRSMTPSIARNGEPVRRPLTANSGEFAGVAGGSPGSVSSVSSSSRGYHPYAYGSTSRAGSTHSSPSVYPIPLAADQYQRRSESRNSSYGGALQEQMRQMMSMNLDQSAGEQPVPGAGAAPSFGETIFRTESPASFPQTESPAPYAMELPMQFTGESYGHTTQHAATMPAQFDKHGQYSSNAIMNSQDQQYATHGGYYPQQHVTL